MMKNRNLTVALVLCSVIAFALAYLPPIPNQGMPSGYFTGPPSTILQGFMPPLGDCDSNCHSGVNLNCMTSTTSYCAAEKCSICLEEAQCNALGLASGRYDMNALYSAIKDPDSGKILSGTDAVNYCAAVHEFDHLCDTSRGTPACMEKKAITAQVGCLISSYTAGCTGTYPAFKDCGNLCKMVTGFTSNLVFSGCVCDSTSSKADLSTKTCCTCFDKCRNTQQYPPIPPQCPLPSQDTLNKWCMSEAEGGESEHGCSYFGGPDSFAIGLC